MNKLIQQLRILLGIAPPDVDGPDNQRPFTTIRDVDRVVVVRFQDLNATVVRMDNMDGIETVSAELLSVADRDPLAVILDFEGTDFVPVAAFEVVFIQLQKRLDGKLRMCNLPAMVAEHFETIRMNTLFQIHAGLDEALSAVTIHCLELPNFQRIPLVTGRLLVGRIPFDEEQHGNALGITKEEARCDGEWLYLPDPHVSKRHALLTRINDDKYAIEDTGSTSSTFVNDQAITERTTLEVGDTIKVGELNIVYSNDITRDRVFLWQQRFDGD